MSTPPACMVAADGERVHRYVAGTLESGNTAEFETHLLGCAECQAAVREGAALRVGLVAAPLPARRRMPLWGWAAVAAVAAGIWLAAPRADPQARLGEVGRGHAPTFSGVPVRAAVDSAGASIDRGLGFYRQGRYREAARELSAVPVGVRTAGVSYYTGLAELLADDPRAALVAFAEAARDSVGSYAVDAHYFRAKAWLRLGRADSALADLAAAGARGRALADSVREVSR